MFDIGFSELVLVFVIGLVVLGPQRLPVAVKTVVGWIRAMRSLAANVQNELAQELKLQELQDSLKKVEQASKNTLSPELKESMEELRKSADSMRRSYLGENEQADDEAYTIHNPLIKRPQDEHNGATPATADHQASAPEQKPMVESAETRSAAKPATTADAPAAGTDNAASTPASPAGQAAASAAAPLLNVSPETSVASSQPTMNDKHGR
ncbi:Sec-independent protein translocase protein TatB [Mixta hanseatica]|uniref:Sec-independent protein translocase protein TatB n=1 Tax=Mixta hanseatica TaxID=2872648 RepID=A0ABY4R6M3_9GAMM|nr:Sec-independent protein translocase protein TatB [Mixta hanseatica]UQY43890.1 Sec-independent protein translocase protein TatB [Mixta hanseatica]